MRARPRLLYPRCVTKHRAALLALACLGSCAAPRPSVTAPVDPAPASSAPAGDTIAREEWRAQAEAHLAPVSCTENTYYRLCFAVEQSECESTIVASARACFERHWPEAPARLQKALDRDAWVRTLMDCVMGRYDKALRAKKSALPNCQALPSWP